tara:strand:- start:1683 stop:1997 length:315 start_codon:yes stop_codon:yes gene_type:complete
MSSRESIKKQLIKETALEELEQAHMLKENSNKMGKVKSFYTNELLLERENDIRKLNKDVLRSEKINAKLRWALLNIRTNLTVSDLNEETKTKNVKIIDKALSDD